jgi:hypothetical protein
MFISFLHLIVQMRCPSGFDLSFRARPERETINRTQKLQQLANYFTTFARMSLSRRILISRRSTSMSLPA